MRARLEMAQPRCFTSPGAVKCAFARYPLAASLNRRKVSM
jgi:hypothetical protein